MGKSLDINKFSISYLFSIGGYFFSTVLTAGVSFFSVPLLIRALGIKEFAKWSLIEPLIILISQLMLFGLNYGILKQVNLDKLPPFQTFKSLGKAAQPCMLMVSIACYFILQILGFTFYQSLWFVVLVYSEGILLLSLSTFRAASSVEGFATGSITKASIFLIALILAVYTKYFVVSEIRDVLFWRFVAAIGGICLSLIVVRLIKNHNFFLILHEKSKSWPLYKDAVIYGMPILITGLLAMVIEFADRYIIKTYFDYITLGQYVVYLKMSKFLYPLIIAPFGLWWPTERFKRLEDDDGGKVFFKNVASVMLAIYLLIGGVIWLFSPWLITWFAPGIPFKSEIVLILITSAIFMGMGAPMNIGLLNAGKTHLNIYAVLCGAFLHIVFCIALIPNFGILGAAIALALSYFSYTALLNYVSQRVYHVPFSYKSMTILIILALFELLIADGIIKNVGIISSCYKSAIYVVLFSLSVFSFGNINYSIIWKK